MSIQKTLEDYIIGLQHVGHIVKDLDAAIDSFVKLYGTDANAIRRVPELSDHDAPTLFAFISVAGTEFELIFDGEISSQRFSDYRVGAESARVLLKIRGMSSPYSQSSTLVNSKQVSKVRSGFHQTDLGNELHLVFDLTSRSAELEEIRSLGERLMVTITDQ